MNTTSESISTSQAHLTTHSKSKGYILDSPKNSVKRQRRESATEKSQIWQEIRQVEEAIARLKEQPEADRAYGEDEEEEILEEEECDVEALEALLKEMDDGALASLLMNPSLESASIDTFLPYLGEKKMAILPPAKSAGVEGNGSGLQVDDNVQKLDGKERGPTDEDAEAALRDRIERGENLINYLAQFITIQFDEIKSTLPQATKRGEKSRLLRTITMKGRLSEGLGVMAINLQVGEDDVKGPQIVDLDVDLGDEVYRALGEDHLTSLINDRNLPAVLLSIRTLLPMAKTRLRLFQSIATIFPSLFQPEEKKMQAVIQTKHSKEVALSILVDPSVMERLKLQNQAGAQLDVIFAISFDQWGHAVPRIAVKPSMPSSITLSLNAQEVLQQLPNDFAEMCSHVQSPLDVGTSLITTIEAFFGLS